MSAIPPPSACNGRWSVLDKVSFWPELQLTELFHERFDVTDAEWMCFDCERYITVEHIDIYIWLRCTHRQVW